MGRVIFVTEGIHEGVYGVVFYREQKEKFAIAKKVYAHFYSDKQCTVERGKGLISVYFIHTIGFID